MHSNELFITQLGIFHRPSLQNGGQTVFEHEKIGVFFLIDWKGRSYVFGGRDPSKNRSYGTAPVKGRGWRQKLVSIATDAAMRNAGWDDGYIREPGRYEMICDENDYDPEIISVERRIDGTLMADSCIGVYGAGDLRDNLTAVWFRRKK